MIEKSILLHRHIYKNAGTTIDHIFESSGIFVKYMENSNYLGLAQDEIIQAVKRNKKIEAISSHTLFRCPDDNLEIRFVDVICIRHPINRLYSIYRYEKGDRDISFSDFLDELALNSPTTYFSAQVNFLGTSGQFYFPPSNAAFEAASSVVLNCRFLLSSEFLRSSFIAFKRLNPNLDVAKKLVIQENLVIENSSSSNWQPDEIVREVIRDEIGADRLAKVELDNKFDIQLYQLALNEVKRRYFAQG